jgi:hypothetical protein
MLKSGVDLRGLKPQMAVAYTIACEVYADHMSHCVITSASDGKHGANSLHYQGLALDLRTRDLPEDMTQTIYSELKDALGEQFDVVLEDDHLHIEFDVKEDAKAPEV